MKSPCFRPAFEEELPRIIEIIRQAQRRMAAAGSRQWQDGYPASEHIANDLKQGYGWVLTDDDEEKSPIGAVASMEKKNDSGVTDRTFGAARIVAYGAVVFDGEPAYEALDGHWLTNGPYVVVHRLAVADEALGQGFGTEFLKHVEQLALRHEIRAFRIDTNFDNRRMLRILDKSGFVRCGTVEYRSGQREAFEKRL